ncbi:hypothetical protein [Flavobacterium sp. RSP15]|uniref:hypothetical protein n=1 Tax=Flavobacterium sp. RSP15 TaxID=2497485 RepID=UPI000F8313D8|nr:hypothetical protein [Flavobacterium sp. RSP15]RTY85524.1 hypothetical protein EKM00_14285 [Flavobacterium sp. RSP15]
MKKMIFIFMLFAICSCNLASGSYPYAEVYEFDVPEDKLIRAVSEFKINNPDFIVPKNIGLVDGRSKDKGDHWYHIWFYYKKENQIIYTWIRGNEFALIAVNEGTELGNWKDINKDFNHSENKDEKKKFEVRILNRIKEKL